MMRLRDLLLTIASLVGISALLASCAREGNTVVNTSPDSTGVTVSGRGEVEIPPDTGFIDVGVQVTAPTVAEARSQAADAATAVINSIKANGVADRDIRTSNLFIQPQYDYSPSGGSPRITGYVVTNTVSVKVRQIDSLSKVVDDAAAAGGNNARLQGIRFGIENDAEARAQARDAAVADARQKAERLASAAGVQLGDAVSISEIEPTNGFDRMLSADMAEARQSGTPIEPGTGMVVVNVQVRWALQ